MASNTTRLAIPYPGLSDPAQITVDMGNIATTVDSKVTGFIQQTTQPSNIAGYLWWCTDSTSASYGMNYCDGTNWHRITTDVTFSSSAPVTAGNKNQIWINTTSGQISFYNGSSWQVLVAYAIPTTTTSGLVLGSTGSGVNWVTPTVTGSNVTGNIAASQVNGSLSAATIPYASVTGALVAPTLNNGTFAGSFSGGVTNSPAATTGGVTVNTNSLYLITIHGYTSSTTLPSSTGFQIAWDIRRVVGGTTTYLTVAGTNVIVPSSSSAYYNRVNFSSTHIVTGATIGTNNVFTPVFTTTGAVDVNGVITVVGLN